MSLGEQFVRLVTLQDAATRTVLVGTGLLGLACGVVGCFAMLRGRSLVTDAVSHASLPGVCVAYLVVGERHLGAFMVGALVFGLLAAGLISVVRSVSRVKSDAAIGLAIGSFFGLGIVLSSIIQRGPGGNRAGIDGFIFGKAASMVRRDALLIGIVALVVLAAVGALAKELRLLCFDRAYAASIGRPTRLLDLILMGLITIATIAGLPAVGVVLMVSLLVIPAAGARFWTDRLGAMLAIAGAFGLASGVVGASISAVLPAPSARGWPTGPMITLVAGALFAGSMLLAPRRGVAALAIARAGLRRRIAGQNLLRFAYESWESSGASPGDRRSLDSMRWTLDDAARGLSMDRSRARRVHRRCELEGLVGGSEDRFALTPAGHAEAARVVRAHRLWEAYLIEHASIAPDHVHRDADMVEHLIGPELVMELERRLAREGRLPIPPSPHAISTRGERP